MNERIEELLLQATTLRGPFIRFKVDQEKFAELIIRECMNAVCDPSTTHLESMTDASAMYTARERIRKHFRS